MCSYGGSLAMFAHDDLVACALIERKLYTIHQFTHEKDSQAANLALFQGS